MGAWVVGVPLTGYIRVLGLRVDGSGFFTKCAPCVLLLPDGIPQPSPSDRRVEGVASRSLETSV